MFKKNKDFVETLKQVLMKSFLVPKYKKSLTIDFAGIKNIIKSSLYSWLFLFFKVKLMDSGAGLKPAKERRGVSKFQNDLMK